MRALVTIALLVALAAPCAAQSRVIVAPTEPPAVQPGTLLCPYCAGNRSTVRYAPVGGYYGGTTLEWSVPVNPAPREPYGDVYWDEDGNFHDHEIPCERFVCSNGHAWTQYLRRCPECEWPEHLRVRTDQLGEKKSDGVIYQDGKSGQVVLPGRILWWDEHGDVHVEPSVEPEVINLGPLPVDKSSSDNTLLAWKIGSSIAVATGSLYDFRRSNDAIRARRARELNDLIRNSDGTVNGWKKFMYTGIEQGSSWALFAKGYKKTAIIADLGFAILYFILGARAQ